MPQHAGKLWDDIVPKLIAVGLATELDQTMLEKMCFFYHCFVVTRDAILAGGDYSSTDAVRLVNNNAKFHDNYRRLAVQFGMTPLARGSLTLTEPETDDEFFQS